MERGNKRAHPHHGWRERTGDLSSWRRHFARKRLQPRGQLEDEPSAPLQQRIQTPCGTPASPWPWSTAFSSSWDSSVTSHSSGRSAPPSRSGTSRTCSCPAWRSGTCCCWWRAPRWTRRGSSQRSGCSGEPAVRSSRSSSSPRSGCPCSRSRLCLLTGKVSLVTLGDEKKMMIFLLQFSVISNWTIKYGCNFNFLK